MHNTKVISVRISEDQWQAIRYHANIHRGYHSDSLPMGELIREAISSKFPIPKQEDLDKYQIYCSGIIFKNDNNG